MRSRLPDVGTTIFTVMSRRALELGAVNLGQGFPDYPIDPRLGELVAEAMAQGHNQYAPMPGVPRLQDAIAAQLVARYGIALDARATVTVTLGATEAIFSAAQALLAPGDEAIVFDPAYDSYDPAIRLAGARCVHIPLQPPLFRYDWERVRSAVNARTRLIVINSPHNPACTVLGAADLDELAAIVTARPSGQEIYVLSDEVYEHVVYAGSRHYSVLGHPALAPHSIAVFSFGKSLHATGLRVGYAVAPPELTVELRKVHQFNTFTIATAFQAAIAQYLEEKPAAFAGLADFFTARRELLTRLLAPGPLRVLPAQGTYFQLVDYADCAALAGLDDMQAATVLLEQGGVATIPLSPFYRKPPRHSLLRLCFAKRDDTLQRAAERLLAFGRGESPP
ncbi:MAG TPA: methionine aminotransferase [Steroidobacteraceae bacterium]|nr:methionine aminotransferase [Steroidobacteraceae bacterium]